MHPELPHPKQLHSGTTKDTCANANVLVSGLAVSLAEAEAALQNCQGNIDATAESIIESLAQPLKVNCL